MIKDVALLGIAVWTLRTQSGVSGRGMPHTMRQMTITSIDEDEGLIAALRAPRRRRRSPGWSTRTRRRCCGSPAATCQPRDRRGSRPGDMDRPPQGHRQVRGPVLVAHVVFTVLINIAKKRGMRERKDADVQIEAYIGGTVDPARFRGAADEWPGHWETDAMPAPFPETPEGSATGRRADGRHTARAQGLPDNSASSSRCATCSDWTPPRCVNCSTSASPISGYSFIVAGLRCDKCSRTI